MDQKQPAVSIVVAVLNGALTLQRCIDSISHQTYRNRELIVMDGGSKDGTIELLQENDKSIAHWRSEPDKGIYNAWNKALDIAQGDWVCFVGSDDSYASPESLEHMMTQPRKCDVRFISGRGLVVDNAGSPIREFGRPLEWRTARRRNLLCHPGSLHHRSLFEEFGRFREDYRIAADYELNLRHCRRAKSGFLNEVVMHIGAGGIGRSSRLLSIRETLTIQASHPHIGRLHVLNNAIASYGEYLATESLQALGLQNRVRKLLIRYGLLNR